MKILVIAPHPDDEVLGCGGTIIKYKKRGDEIYLCLVTKMYVTPEWSKEYIKKREKQAQIAIKKLGVKKTLFLNLPIVKLDTVPQKKINDLLSKIVTKVNPDIVFIPHQGDVNIDHRLVFASSLVALRPKPGSRIKKILSYEILSATEWGSHFGGFLPDVYEDITKEIKEKIEVMKIYKVELKKFPHPRSIEAIEILAKKRGSEAGVQAAEAFMLLREIIK